jgi:hypothetical protein
MPTLPYLTDTSTQLSGTYTTSTAALDNYATSNYVNSFWTTNPTNNNIIYLNKQQTLGKVGIGVTSSTGALEMCFSVDPNSASAVKLRFGSQTANTNLSVNIMTASRGLRFLSSDATNTLFNVGWIADYNDPQPRNYIFFISRTALTMIGDGSFSGNFAIGTTPGTYNLNVNGSINSTSFYQNGTLIDFSSYATNANLTTNYYNKSSTDTLLNAKENTLTFSSPLTRTTNTIGINLSAYSTTGTDTNYLLKTGGTMTGALLNTSSTTSEFKGIQINHLTRITHIPYLPDNNIYFRAPLIIDHPDDYLSFGSRLGDNIIRLYGTNFGFGINGATLRYNVPAGSVHRFYHGTTNTAWIDDTGRLKATTFEGSGASLTNVPYSALTGTVPFYTKAENDTLLNAKQPNLTAATNLLGIGSVISALDYNKITLNKPTNFQADWNTTIINKPTYFQTDWNTTITNKPTNFQADWNSTIINKPTNFQADWNSTIINKPTYFPIDPTIYYNKTQTDNLLNAKEQILTFSSPLTRSTNTISINLSSYSTTGTDPTYLKLIGGTLTGDLTGTNITGTKVNCADATGVNAACLGRLLNVVGTAAVMRIWRNDGANSPAMEFISGPTTSGTSYTKFWDMGIGGATGTNYFYIRDRKPPTTSVNRLIIDDSGNIGIGTTTNASYRLNVEGALNALTIYRNGAEIDARYLKLAGGTLTGALNATSISTSGTLTVNDTLTVGSYANAKYAFLGGLRIGGWDGNTLYQDTGDLGITVHNTTPKITFNFFGGNNTIMDIKNTSINFYQPVYFKNDVWHSSGEGAYRLYFGSGSGTTYLAGGNTDANGLCTMFMSGSVSGFANLMSIYNNGNIIMGLSSTNSAFLIVHGSIACRLFSVNKTNTDYVGTQGNRPSQGSTILDTLCNLYDTFTGMHRCFTEDELYNKEDPQKFKDDYVGRIVISSGKIATDISNENNGWDIYYDKDGITSEDAVPMIELSRTKKDKRVFGVMGSPSRKNSRAERMIINSIGEGPILVCNCNGNIENGDYIQSSGILGYGEKQDDDLLHNYTVAKATMDCSFELDSLYYNCYEIDDLDANGNKLRVAFIACTYHSG